MWYEKKTSDDVCKRQIYFSNACSDVIINVTLFDEKTARDMDLYDIRISALLLHCSL